MPTIKDLKNKIKEGLGDIGYDRRKESIANAALFAKANRNCVIIVMDLKSDDVICAYRNKYLANRWERRLFPYIGAKMGVVKNILLGRGKTKERARDITQVKEMFGEFLYQMSDKVGTPEENMEKQVKILRKDNEYSPEEGERSSKLPELKIT